MGTNNIIYDCCLLHSASGIWNLMEKAWAQLAALKLEPSHVSIAKIPATARLIPLQRYSNNDNS